MIGWIKRNLFRAKMNLVHGIDVIEISEPVREQVIIRYKNTYISVMIGDESGDPVDLGWSNDPMVFNVPVREFYEAVKK